jgi:hypothetical protein
VMASPVSTKLLPTHVHLLLESGAQPLGKFI